MNLWRFVRSLFACTHAEMIRERDAHGHLWLVCTSCGHQVALNLSEPAKVRKLVKQWAKSRQQVSGPTVKATVYVMPRRRKEQS